MIKGWDEVLFIADIWGRGNSKRFCDFYHKKYVSKLNDLGTNNNHNKLKKFSEN